MPSDTARNWIKTARLCRHGGIAAQLLIVIPRKLIAESPHETDSGQKSTQLRDPVHSPAIPFREFRANLCFLFFRKSVQPPMIHALDRVNALEKQAVRI